jgi:hypothetical protein
MTFKCIMPYLKGFYLTLNAWRPCRGTDGWKMSEPCWLGFLQSKYANGELSDQQLSDLRFMEQDGTPPPQVKAVPRLLTDILALVAFFSATAAPEIMVRSLLFISVVYGFGDASGGGFGSATTSSTQPGVSYRLGVWIDIDESSNWREFANCVDSLEHEAILGHLSNATVFFFTDNSTVEAAIHKGTSSSRKLLNLVIRLMTLQLKFSFTLKVIHVAGTRMIVQGTDGLSRGQLNEGVMDGHSMLSFIPIHESALERSSTLEDWLTSWLVSPIFLSPIDWYERGHSIKGWNRDRLGFDIPILESGQTYVWSPPPIVADAALEELRIARLKRQDSTHVFVCPRLCTTDWFRQFYKAVDLMFPVPPCEEFWPSNMYEPLIIGIAFPFIHRKPWQLRRTPRMASTYRQLQSVWGSSGLDPRTILRKLLGDCRKLDSVPDDVVRKLLQISVLP